MELTERISEAIAHMPDVKMNSEIWESGASKKFTTFYINRRGTVLQFTAPYPSVDEDYNNTFVQRVLKEI